MGRVDALGLEPKGRPKGWDACGITADCVAVVAFAGSF